jgi:hypothetical protein
MNRLDRACFALIAFAVVSSCSSGREDRVRVTSETGVFANESDPAAVGSWSLPQPTPITTVGPGQSVRVLSDTCGKDYWACHVRTQDSQEGWVLCGSLDYKPNDDS